MSATAHPKQIRVAVTQAEPAWLDLEESVAKTCSLITEAAKNGAQLVTFPECWIPGYPAWIWLEEKTLQRKRSGLADMKMDAKGP